MRNYLPTLGIKITKTLINLYTIAVILNKRLFRCR